MLRKQITEEKNRYDTKLVPEIVMLEQTFAQLKMEIREQKKKAMEETKQSDELSKKIAALEEKASQVHHEICQRQEINAQCRASFFLLERLK